MSDIVVFAEEPSGKIVAEELARRLGVSERAICIEHQGKSDLERSFPRKIGGWRAPKSPRFVIMRDNDGANCILKKSALLRLVPRTNLDQVKIRLVMQELESWYLGDPIALRDAGLIDAKIAEKLSKGAKFRNPDTILHAKEVFRRTVDERGQIELARRVGPFLDPERNRSPSFRAFVDALRWAANTGS